MYDILVKSKKYLIDQAIHLYLDRRWEVDVSEYSDHFGDMGSIIAKIDKIGLFSELIKDLEDGKFEVLGYFSSDEDMIENFLNQVTE